MQFSGIKRIINHANFLLSLLCRVYNETASYKSLTHALLLYQPSPIAVSWFSLKHSTAYIEPEKQFHLFCESAVMISLLKHRNFSPCSCAKSNRREERHAVLRASTPDSTTALGLPCWRPVRPCLVPYKPWSQSTLLHNGFQALLGPHAPAPLSFDHLQVQAHPSSGTSRRSSLHSKCRHAAR